MGKFLTGFRSHTINAAVVVTRLISIPNKNIYCFDLGHKAIASEMPLPRVEIFGLEKAVHKGQSEEHLILEYKQDNNFKVGDLFYGIPYHICPTVAKYNKAYTVTEGELGLSLIHISEPTRQSELSYAVF